MFTINGVKFKPDKAIDYGWDWQEFDRQMLEPPFDERLKRKLTDVENQQRVFRQMLMGNLWSITAFVLKIPCAFHPWWIETCREVQQGPDTNTLDIWARGHGKSSIVTCARTIQMILRDPNETVCIFSYTKAAAMKFFQQVKFTLESSDFLKWAFPDVLWGNPFVEAPKWSEDNGIFVKRSGFQKEPTLMASGLLEAMPTGNHFSLRIYDDVMVEDIADNPETIEKLKERFDMSENLGRDGGKKWIIGTPYHHEDLLSMLRNRKKPDGSPSYHLRLKPATEEGAWNGNPVFISQEYLDELKQNRRKFSSQQLLNPTPVEIQRLSPDFLRDTLPADIPPHLYRFMLVDPAGERRDRTGDCWALAVIGVDPYRDDLGASDIYILDLMIEEMGYDDAIKQVVDMFVRNGRILQLGVEKVALSTTEVHVLNALRSRGRYLSVEDGTLVMLRPGGRSKANRIESNLVWPLNNGKVHISKAVPEVYRARLRAEMERFPWWHDDGLDSVSYVYDLLKSYRFGARPSDEPVKRKMWLEKWQRQRGQKWLTV